MSRFPQLEKLILFGFALALLLLLISGLIQVWFLGFPLEGYWLLLHVSFGGLLTACLCGFVLLQADDSRFDGQQTGRKICFWLITTAGLGLILSAVTPMFPLLGAENESWVMIVHGYCGFLAVIAFIGYGVLLRKESQQEKLK